MQITPLLAISLAALASPTLAVTIATPKVPLINIEFNGYSGTGDMTNATNNFYSLSSGPYDTEFVGTGPAISVLGVPGTMFSPLGPDPAFISDDITLNYNDFLEELVNNQLPVSEVGGITTFTGTDILTAPDGSVLDLSLAGNVLTTGTTTTENLTFTDPDAIVTYGTGSLAGLSGTVPFLGSLAGYLETSAMPAGVIAPHGLPPEPITGIYDAQYGPLASSAVPEPAPVALLTLGLLPVGLIALRRKRMG